MGAGVFDPCGGWFVRRCRHFVGEALWVVSERAIECASTCGVNGVCLTVVGLVKQTHKTFVQPGSGECLHYYSTPRTPGSGWSACGSLPGRHYVCILPSDQAAYWSGRDGADGGPRLNTAGNLGSHHSQAAQGGDHAVGRFLRHPAPGNARGR
jgi:hypothetical protein